MLKCIHFISNISKQSFEYSFSQCQGIWKLTISEGITQLSEVCFYNCIG